MEGRCFTIPFKSKAQEKWAFATKQPFAKKWAGITTQSDLPQKVSKFDGRRRGMKRLGLKKRSMADARQGRRSTRG